MNLNNKILSYFKFSKGPKFVIFEKRKSRIYISRKLSTRTFLTWIYACFSLLLMNIIKNRFFGNNGSIDIHIRLKYNTINLDGAVIIKLIIALITIIIIAIIIIVKSKSIFKKLEPQKTNLDYYKREIPSQLRPAHVRMLTNDGLIDEYSIAATILDLIDRKYLEITRSKEKEFLFDNTEIFIRKTNKETTNLLLYEQYIIDWITKASETNKNESQKFAEFEALLILSFPLNNYYQENEKYSSTIIMSVAYLLIGMALTVVSTAIIFLLSFITFSYILGKILLITPEHILKLNGVNERDEWFDLKRFLLDFTQIKDKSPEMIVLWNYYLSYSIALDVDSVASKEIKRFFEKNTNGISVDANNTTPCMQMRLDWQYVMSRIKEIVNQEASKYNNK